MVIKIRCATSGEDFTSVSNSVRLSTRTSMSLLAITVAVRGPPSRVATSPKKSPGPKRATSMPWTWQMAVPDRTIRTSAPRLPAVVRAFPAGMRMRVPRWDRCLLPLPLQPAKMGRPSVASSRVRRLPCLCTNSTSRTGTAFFSVQSTRAALQADERRVNASRILKDCLLVLGSAQGCGITVERRLPK